jgi:putative heme-binding domain-containing protein
LSPFQAGKLNLENKLPRLSLLVRADGTPDTLQAVRKLSHDPQLASASREPFLRLLTETGDAADLASLLRLEDRSLQVRLLPVLEAAMRARGLRPAGDLGPALRPLIESHNAALRAEALKLAGVLKLEVFRSGIETTALDTAASEPLRRAAIAGLAGLGGDSSRNLIIQLARESTPSIRSAAIVALCGFDLEKATRIASEYFAETNAEAALNEVFTALLQREGGAEALARSLAAKPPSKLAAEAGLRVASATGRGAPQLVRLLAENAGFRGHGKTMRLSDITLFAEEVRATGDAKRGSEIFHRPELGCIACHAINGQGGKIGPELSALGTAQPIDFIVGAILDPQKEVKEGYTSTSVTTTDGEEYQGYLVRQTAADVLLRDVLQNKEILLRRDTIREQKQHGSVMPPGLADLLTRSEFRDLVRYLSELGKPIESGEQKQP